MRPLRTSLFLPAMIGAALVAGCGEATKSSGVEGTNASAKQSWYTPLSPAIQDELRQRALHQTELQQTES